MHGDEKSAFSHTRHNACDGTHRGRRTDRSHDTAEKRRERNGLIRVSHPYRDYRTRCNNPDEKIRFGCTAACYCEWAWGMF